jgi:glyoxylate/succinic semialdehyde reductase
MQGPIGFVGLGIMGKGMVKNLLTKVECNLVVWNRGVAASEELSAAYPGKVEIAETPAAVVSRCKYTFCMLSTEEASIAVFDRPGDGVIDGVTAGKVIIDCATLSPERMVDECARISAKGGLFIEAPVSGSKVPAENGQLIFLCGGEESVYNEIGQALDAMGKAKFLFGPVGNGSRVKLVVNMVMGTMMSAFAEGMQLSEAAAIPRDQLLQVLELSAIANPMFKLKGPNLINENYPAHFPLKHAQKDMRLALALGNELGVTMPTTVAANDMYKSVLDQSGDEDFSAVAKAVPKQKQP